MTAMAGRKPKHFLWDVEDRIAKSGSTGRNARTR